MDLNPVVTPVRDIGEFIREQRTSAQISVRALAVKAGVSNPYLSQIERGLRRPSAEILTQIAHALSISVESLLARAGILETADAPEVVRAIRADCVLTERHKNALVDIYSAFRKEAEATAPDAEAVSTTAGHPASTSAGRGSPSPTPASQPSTVPDARTGDGPQ